VAVRRNATAIVRPPSWRANRRSERRDLAATDRSPARPISRSRESATSPLCPRPRSRDDRPYIVFTVLRLVVKNAGALSSSVLVALIAGLLALVSVISIAIHVLFEKPVMASLRARLT
jgi:hypothetical protein